VSSHGFFGYYYEDGDDEEEEEEEEEKDGGGNMERPHKRVRREAGQGTKGEKKIF
jgi:hypothetical protein